MRSLIARTGPGVGTGLAKAATVPSCAMCAAYPVLAGPLAAAGLFGAGVILHNLLVVLAPLNLVFLGITYRLHRQPRGLIVAAAGVLLIMLHLAFHVIPWSHPIMRAFHPYEFEVGMSFIWLGMTLLLAGVVMDWRAQRRPRLVSRQSP